MVDLAAAFSQVANAVGAAFGGPFAASKLLYAGTPTYDDGGSIVVPGVPSEVDCSVQVDAVTEEMRADEDFMEKDVRLVILGPDALDTAPDVRINAGKFAGKRYSLQTCRRDPMGFGWECRAREVVNAAPGP